MTELEAVNTLLSVIGEAPVDKLSDPSINEISDSALARKTLNEVSRDVQAEGWSWNTDWGVELTKTSANEFVLPSNVLSCLFSPNRYPDKQYVIRGLKVYNRAKRTTAFGADLNGALVADHLISQLDWDEVPHTAQQYIVIRSARIYSDRYLNSNAIYTYTAQDEEYARAMMIRDEERHLDNNLLWGNDRGVGQGIGFIPSDGLRYRGV